MNQGELQSAVAAAKPVFGQILQKHGGRSLLEYYRSHKHQPTGVFKSRSQELIATLKELLAHRISPRVAESVAHQLPDYYHVSTAAHHDPATHPFFVSHILAEAEAARARKHGNVIVLSCAGISLNNSSFPRGLLVHDMNGRRERLHLVSRKNHQRPVYERPPFTAQSLVTATREIDELALAPARRTLLRAIFHDAFGSLPVLAARTFGEQITRGVHALYQRLPGMLHTNVVYLEQELLAAELLRQHHLHRSTEISWLLFNPRGQRSFIGHFDGIIGAATLASQKGTHFFWALTPTRRLPLWCSGGFLENKDAQLRIRLEPKVIDELLQDGSLMPSMALTYSLLAFYYGLSCGGGFSQVGYLTEMRDAYAKVLAAYSGKKSAEHLLGLPTQELRGDVVAVHLSAGGGSVPATALDLAIHGNRKTAANIRSMLQSTTLAQAVAPLMPELYQIVSGVRGVEPQLQNFPTCMSTSRCHYCGNNPTMHGVAKTNEFMGLLTVPLEPVSNGWLGRAVHQLLGRAAPLLVRAGSLVGAVRFNADPGLALTTRSRAIWDEAINRHVPMRQLKILGRLVDVYEAKIPTGRTIVFESIPVPNERKTDALDWMDDKALLKKRLLAHQLPAVRGGKFFRFETLQKRFREIEKPVIIKPAAGSRGRHTTTFIYTEEELREAFDIAKQISHQVMLEEHLIGSVYRGTVISGRLIGVNQGNPPRVTGDGESTIRKLIAAKNDDRPENVREVVITPYLERFLARRGLTLQTTLGDGETTDLSEKIGLSYGGYSSEVLPNIHPDVREMFERAARVIDFPIIGFDFITPNISLSPYEQRCGIIEANSLPFIDLHHHPASGPAINAARHVWDWWV